MDGCSGSAAVDESESSDDPAEAEFQQLLRRRLDYPGRWMELKPLPSKAIHIDAAAADLRSEQKCDDSSSVIMTASETEAATSTRTATATASVLSPRDSTSAGASAMEAETAVATQIATPAASVQQPHHQLRNRS